MNRPTRLASQRAAAVLLLAAVGLGCGGAPRFASPFYGPGGPPFISPMGHSYWRQTGALGARTPTHRLILIGDAGAALPDEGTLADLGVWSRDLPDATTVVFLGDNLYPRGLGEDDERGEAILLQELRATRARKVFVPGNHDWGDPIPRASTLAHEERFIDGFTESPARLLPKGGCPGPTLETLVEPGAGLARGLRLLAIDLDWWMLDSDDRPSCAGNDTENEFVASLGRTLHEHAGEHLVVVAHHPLRTGGPHGGYGRSFWMRHLGVPLAGAFGIDLQDVDASAYRRMVSRLLPAFTQAPPLVYAAGHDHGLQVIEGRDTAGTLVVSGAGSARNITTVTAISGTLFAHATAGFVVLDFYGDADFGDALAGDRVMLRVIETGRSRPVYEMELPLP